MKPNSEKHTKRKETKRQRKVRGHTTQRKGNTQRGPGKKPTEEKRKKRKLKENITNREKCEADV